MLLSFTRIRCADPGEPLEDANPHEMFEPGKDVITSRTPEELDSGVRYVTTLTISECRSW
jgi:hypothetical protein